MDLHVLLTGATGLLGRAVYHDLQSRPDTRVTGWALSRASGDIHSVDLLDFETVAGKLQSLRPDVIVHTAAHRKPDVCENDPDATVKLNVDTPRHIARIAAGLGTRVLYISTDYVFDGTSPPYRPEDPTNPLNTYGRSKRDGERALRETGCDYRILRVPILYGNVESPEESAVTSLLDIAKASEPKNVDHWATRYPTHVEDCAVVIGKLICRWKELGTILHWSSDEPMSRYEMACAIAEAFSFPSNHLIPASQPPPGAPRPRNSHLDCSELESAGIGRRTPFKVGIAKALERFVVSKK